MSTSIVLPPGWQCSTWPLGWQPRTDLPLTRVGGSAFPEKFCLAVHAPDMPATGAAVIFTYAARENAVTLLEITSVGMEVGAHLAQVLAVLTPDALQQTAQQQVAAFVSVPIEGPVPANGKAIRRYSYVTDDHLKEVAAVYSDARDAGAAPTRAVQHHFGVSHSTAAKWVGRARRQGLLAPTARGAAS